MADFEGWEVLPDDGFLEIHDDDDDGGKIFSRKFGVGSNNVFKNYFICPSPKSPQFVDSTEHSRVPKQLVTVPIQLEPADDYKLPDQEFLKQLTKTYPVEMNINPSVVADKIRAPSEKGGVEADQDPVSQVSFKKKKEPEFVEMKMDSPKSNNNRGIKPQIDAGPFQFDDKGEAFMGEALESKISSPKFRTINNPPEVEKEVTWEEENSGGGLNLWKWSMTGIGAICSFGVAAAATVCIIILGGRHKNRRHQDNQKLQFHIYAEDNKTLKQVVHHASKLNEAISAVRGVPLARAHITFGGYYDGL